MDDQGFYDGSFQSLLMSDDATMDFTEHEDTPSVEKVVSDKRGSRTKNFTREEDLLLVAAYLNTTKDSVTGNNQQSSTFWGRICKNIEDNRGTSIPRTQNSIKSHWTDINKKCAKFVGCLSKIERLNQSGQTDQGRLTEAQELYAIEVGKPFQYHHCWEILKDDPKWQATIPNKKQRTTQEQTPDGTSHPTEDHSPTANEARPMGRKAAKELLKRKACSEPNSISSINTSEFLKDYWSKKEEFEHAKVERHERALKQHEEQLQIAKQMHDIEVLKTEMEIMKTDTSNMEANAAAYYEALKRDILQKRGFD